MDSKTSDAYLKRASEYSHDWLSQAPPDDMYDLLKKYFLPNRITADIGCGNGRDAHWLTQQGFDVYGFDGSEELLKIASQQYLDVKFQKALLPKLEEIQNQFDNVICETVIMHLPKSEIIEAVTNLKRILRKDGILYLSWRVTEGEDMRHQDGRLYSAFDPDFVLKEFSQDDILHFEDVTSQSSGKRICRLICRKQ